MKEQFVPYKLALKLEELGFKEECLAFYLNEEIQIFGQDYLMDILLNDNGNCLAPLWQQAFDWFRVKYSLHVSFQPYPKGFDYMIFNCITGESDGFTYSYNTYKEARQACLEKLIEICKTK